MGNVSITASAVKTSSSSAALKTAGVSASAFTAGQPLYLTAGNKLAPAGAAEVSPLNQLKGIALCSCPGADQPCYYAKEDEDFNPGFTPVVGETYVVSHTIGAICPIGDLGASDEVNYIGVGKAGGKLSLKCYATGIAKPA